MKFYERFKPTTLVTLISIIFLFYSCGGDSNDSSTNDIDNIVESKEMLIKNINSTGDGGSYSSHFYYTNNQLVKSSILNRAYYETYDYNSYGKINLITQYHDDGNSPNNSEELDFTHSNNFNDEEYYIEYDWINELSFVSSYTDNQYNFNDKTLVEGASCMDDFCEPFKIYYKNNQIDKVIYNEGKPYQNIYTFEFDNGINPMNILFRKYGYVESIFDYFFDFYYVNNATAIYKNGELVYTASYQYNADNYPTQVSYHRISNGETGKAVFTYQE